ncbi:FAD-binding protein [Mycolicibacterium sp. S2-37]|uniref:D-arabinono-1,4-lactone oxidase n=1 Tax=Mycolicibacterium sp. S2-37 TaxID=2810297 RepID=UPI001A94769A|nr:D-arabinono-1,4-lactone oxidase [Mycolicibacterium sp. S2-37]MBO0678266.1 FAD-binding protein [Mycolicibacterium sp. S2-37]
MTPRAARAVPDVPFVESRPWTNWSLLATSTPAFTMKPRTEEEVVDCVRFAVANRLPVRPVGTGHSWTALCTTDGVQIDVSALTGVRVVDRERKLVAVKAGTTVWDLGEALWEEGFSLKNQGDIDVQTIAGALSTGTHGSGIELGILASSVHRVRLVDGRGDLVEITAEDADALHAAQVSLGMLGIIVEVELEVVDRYYLEEEVTYPSWQDLLDGWERDVADNRHSSWFWFPDDTSPPLYQLPVPEGESVVDRAHLRRINVAEGPARQIGPNRRIDRNYLIYHGEFTGPYYEFEIFVPAEHAREAVTRIREIVQTTRPGEKFPVQPRWVKGDDALLSPAYKTDSVGISVSGNDTTDYNDYFREVYAALAEFGPRMHWGKVHFLGRRDVESMYPEFGTFQEVRNRFDPDGIFLNDYTRTLFA